jgi:hypothetical protein
MIDFKKFPSDKDSHKSPEKSQIQTQSFVHETSLVINQKWKCFPIDLLRFPF